MSLHCLKKPQYPERAHANTGRTRKLQATVLTPAVLPYMCISICFSNIDFIVWQLHATFTFSSEVMVCRCAATDLKSTLCCSMHLQMQLQFKWRSVSVATINDKQRCFRKSLILLLICSASVLSSWWENQGKTLWWKIKQFSMYVCVFCVSHLTCSCAL